MGPLHAGLICFTASQIQLDIGCATFFFLDAAVGCTLQCASLTTFPAGASHDTPRVQMCGDVTPLPVVPRKSEVSAPVAVL